MCRWELVPRVRWGSRIAPAESQRRYSFTRIRPWKGHARSTLHKAAAALKLSALRLAVVPSMRHASAGVEAEFHAMDLGEPLSIAILISCVASSSSEAAGAMTRGGLRSMSEFRTFRGNLDRDIRHLEAVRRRDPR